MSEETTKPKTKAVPPVVARNVLLPFILVTTLFALWGFANDITNPMVAAFKKILLISNFESSLVQFAFYGGYCVMAVPAAIFIKRFSYKSGLLLGLSLYAAAALFFPVAGQLMAFWAFLLAYFVMTCGLSFLETTSNPYILAMGAEETSTQRLNMAQSFNPMGSLTGMCVAMVFILNMLASVSTDHEIAPILATEAQARISHVAAAADIEAINTIAKEEGIELEGVVEVDAAKWAVIQGQSLDNWIDGTTAETVISAVESSSPVDWAAVQQSIKTTQDRLAQILPVLAGEDDDAATWKHLQDAGLTTFLDGKAVASIARTIAEGKRVKWVETALLAGTPGEEPARRLMSEVDKERWAGIQQSDLDVLQGPYFMIGIVVALVLLVFIFAKLPKAEQDNDKSLHIVATTKRLFTSKKYIEGVIAQAFYVGAQIMCWTFIIQYGANELGMTQGEAQGYNIAAMIIFCSSRFVCTFLLRFVSPGGLLGTLAVVAFGLVAGTIFIDGMVGLYCLVAVSACMSLMFPTIYGIALKGLGDDAKLGASGLIMAIGGGCLMPPMQAAIMDMDAIHLGFMTLTSTRASFVLPLICFVVIAHYGFRTHWIHQD